jgi:subtilisin family serine protease
MKKNFFYPNQRLLHLTIIPILCFYIVACGGGKSSSGSEDGSPNPGTNTLQVTPNIQNGAQVSNTLKPVLYLDFSQAINTQALSSNQFTFTDLNTNTQIPLSLSSPSNTRLLLYYSTPLIPSHQYQLQIPTIQALANPSAISTPSVIQFTQQADQTSPTVSNFSFSKNINGQNQVVVTLNEEVTPINNAVLKSSAGNPITCVTAQRGDLPNQIIFTPTTSNCVSKGKRYSIDLSALTDFSNQSIGYSVSQSRLFIEDTLFNYEWHLNNTGPSNIGGNGGTAGNINQDLNILPTWEMGITGSGAIIAVVDDGLYISHPDLADNIATGLSYDYTTGGTNPTGGAHGTAVAGTVAAVSNTIGVVGSAFNAKLAGFNLLQSQSDANTFDAMTRQKAIVSVSNNSWGVADDFGDFAADGGNLWISAVNDGTDNGRVVNGVAKGVVYLWAAGNGGDGEDNSNYDGNANYNRILAIGGVDSEGKHPSYAEEGANVLVAGPTLTIDAYPFNPSTNPHKGIYTTYPMGRGDIDSNHTTSGSLDYRSYFNGTSAATPAVAGVVALILSANPNLSWRDARWILASTARVNDPTDSDWAPAAFGTNSKFNHKYGFGTPDAYAAVQMALSNSYTPLGSYTSCSRSVNSIAASINGTTNTQTVNISSGCPNTVEFVELTLDITGSVDSLDVKLNSPTNRISQLAVPHTCTAYTGSCDLHSIGGWRFGSVRHLGESSSGSWQILINGNSLTLNSFILTIWGH